MISAENTSSPEVLNKYQAAADITNRALKLAISECKPGASLAQICKRVDAEIEVMASKVYGKQKEILKGIAFPTAISVNNVLCHSAPMEEGLVLKEGDLAKIELGAHIDGFPALVCHSMIVGEGPVTGRTADLLQAAQLGAEAAIRLLKEGKSSTDVRNAVLAICKDHDVQPIEGMMSHAVGKNSLALDGLSIIFRPTDHQKGIPPTDFDLHQVWVVDVAVSLGKGQVQLLDTHKTTIWARNDGVSYALKLKGSRALCSEVQSRFGGMAFHLRALEDQTRSRMALQECVAHQVMQPYDVQGEKDPLALTARFMFTAAIMPAGPLKLTDQQFDAAMVKSAVNISNPEIKALLDAPIRPKKK